MFSMLFTPITACGAAMGALGLNIVDALFTPLVETISSIYGSITDKFMTKDMKTIYRPNLKSFVC